MAVSFGQIGFRRIIEKKEDAKQTGSRVATSMSIKTWIGGANLMNLDLTLAKCSHYQR
jgi:hypothetical protein